VLIKIGKAPENCIMIGNNPVEDMSACEIGIETFLVTDCLENENGVDISVYARGKLADVESLLMSLPDVVRT